MRRIQRLVLTALGALALGSCFQPESQLCSSGLVCPRDSHCSAFGDQCITTDCGNGIMDPGELCDDGNVRSGDGCSADCQSTEYCGNNYVDSVLGESCDDGNRLSGDNCSASCQLESCGDGFRNPGSGEQCDDGNQDDGDDCLHTCRTNRCGDGFLNDAGTEDGGHVEWCDDRGESALCNVNCTFQRCGDGVVNATAREQCDTAGASSSCNPDCTVSRCGDGLFNPDAGEQCDTAGNSASCNANCTISSCGDNFFNPDAGEQCDDGDPDDETGGCTYGVRTCTVCGAMCLAQTLSGPYCGDGDAGFNHGIDTADGEQCDDGNSVDETTCPYGVRTCVTCSHDCLGPLTNSGPYCGDTIIQISDGEACDDATNGNTNCAYGTPSCQVCSANCGSLVTVTGPYCGDSVRQADAGEACDDTTNGNTSCPYGTPSCQVCSADCKSQSPATGPYCGDRIPQADAGEACDDSTNGDTSCSYGTPSCQVCNTNCSSLVPRTGPYCGDGNVNGPEACDDRNTLACGSCSANCLQDQLTEATGNIITGPSSSIDGGTFTLDDGRNPVKVFEFSIDGGVQPGRIAISLASTNAVGMGTRIQVAIGGSGIGIDATIPGGGLCGTTSCRVDLTNTRNGVAGNRPILEDVIPPEFKVDGMDGGGGRDCPMGTPCTTNQDCAPNLGCQGPSGGKTCQ